MRLKYVVIVSSHSPSDFGCWIDNCVLHGLISEIEFSRATLLYKSLGNENELTYDITRMPRQH